MATENIMMDAVKEGGDRQQLHEVIRQLSMEAGKHVKVEGKENPVGSRIYRLTWYSDKYFAPNKEVHN